MSYFLAVWEIQVTFLLLSIVLYSYLLFRIGHPDLHDHFKKYNIDMELFVSKWFVCLFMDVLPTEVCSWETAQKDHAF